MKKVLSVSRRVALLGLSMVGSSLAVDPPPAHLLDAPVEQQLSYTRYVGEESERLRARVAEDRFQAKKQKRAILAEGLQSELSQQQALLTATSQRGPAATPAEAEVSSSGVPYQVTSRRSVLLGGMVLLLALLYAFRERLLPSEKGEI